MAKPSDQNDWEEQKSRIVGLGERSFRKSYYPQLRENLDRLERFRTLLDRTSDCVVLISLPDGTVSDANAALGQLFGRSSVTLVGEQFVSLGLGDAAEILDTLCVESRQERDSGPVPSHSDVTEFRRDGQSVWLELTYRLATLEGRCYGVIVGRDITERRRAHEMVASLLAEKEALLDNALVGIAMVRERVFTSCNRRFEEIL